MNIAVIGTGYVGLVTGTCFAEMGHNVTCVDIDADKIEGLKHGVLPIYEPGLDDMVDKNFKEGRLHFTTSLAEAAQHANIFFIAVGTPPGEDGSADLKYVLAVARDLGKVMVSSYNIVVDKSTVPVGTADKVRATVQAELDKRGNDIRFDVVSNPEFLKEGAAIDDFMRPDRVVIGTDSEKAAKIMHDLYAPFMRNHEVIIAMGVREAEMTKYTANAMLATKISFMNEIAALCERLDVDVEQVRLGIGSDRRIGYHFIYPGCGYGGSCFPKDVKALLRMAQENGLDAWVLDAVERRNDRQKHRLAEKIFARFGTDLSGKTFALWGLAFKPDTDDMREAPSLVLIEQLITAGATIRAHDPVAIETATREMKQGWLDDGRVRFFEHQYDALDGADAMVLVTEWKPFRNPDFDRIKKTLTAPIIFDGRNQYDPSELKDLGFEYFGIGRGKVGG
ncbi:UDP-glucose dehydrogenase family protein [Sulfurivermis fontis]|uniref:UDP-glucose dehydrogenase family protein n=1 Tax=Sulfurivermis fontis TaxID=1972068 RepID=UPI000FDAD95A|nr:UDP-glucose/GDP-mannose dehydrogenase family protein [Sulfurivermis fontis]